jgi:hypothetical protein
MIVNTAMTLAFAAAYLATIATVLAADAEVARRSVVVKHSPIVNPGEVSASGLRGRTWSRASSMSGYWRQTPLSAKRGCERSAARSPIRNSMQAASRASIKMSRT